MIDLPKVPDGNTQKPQKAIDWGKRKPAEAGCG